MRNLEESLILFILDGLGANPEPDEDGKFPFHLAASLGKEQSLRYLIAKLDKRPFDINVADKNGDTPLHEAAKRCHEDRKATSMVQFLIFKGVFYSEL